MQTVLLTSIQGFHDIGMLQLSNQFHFAIETGDSLFGIHTILAENLDRNGTIETRVDGPKNASHSSFANRLQNSIVSNKHDLLKIHGFDSLTVF